MKLDTELTKQRFLGEPDLNSLLSKAKLKTSGQCPHRRRRRCPPEQSTTGKGGDHRWFAGGGGEEGQEETLSSGEGSCQRQLEERE